MAGAVVAFLAVVGCVHLAVGNETKNAPAGNHGYADNYW
jgi:hypothetical protein